MHGLGNDFVIINNPTSALTKQEIINICNRHTGVGCDQLIVLKDSHDADCEMTIYNQDGSSAGACGNATRCVAKLLEARAIRVGGRRLNTTLHEDGEVSVDMGLYTNPEPMEALKYSGYYIDVGNPHFVLFGEAMDINAIGPKLERHIGANINLACITGSNSINLNVWERGAGQTLACGSGACATAIVAHKFMNLESSITVTQKGGVLRISISDSSIIMRGPAEKVFVGRWDK